MSQSAAPTANITKSTQCRRLTIHLDQPIMDDMPFAIFIRQIGHAASFSGRNADTAEKALHTAQAFFQFDRCIPRTQQLIHSNISHLSSPGFKTLLIILSKVNLSKTLAPRVRRFNCQLNILCSYVARTRKAANTASKATATPTPR
jgi:hypothetical protein